MQSDIIVGKWITVDGKVAADKNCEAIDKYVSTSLVEVGQKDGGWTRILRDKIDSSFWELTYQHGEWQGGGPPTLRKLQKKEVEDFLSSAQRSITYQLVIQVPVHDPPKDVDFIVGLERKVEDMIDEKGEVDGHDIGAGQGNIFIVTQHPRECFETLLPLFEGGGATEFRIAFRPMESLIYTILWPSTLQEFSIT